MIDLISHLAKFERECALASACILFNNDGSVNYHPTEEQIYDLFNYNFERFYYGNRAPFPLFLSEDWIHDEHRRGGLIKFIENLAQHKDVYFVTIQELIEWMKNSQTVADYSKNQCKPIEKTACAMSNPADPDLTRQFKKKCDYSNIGELGGLTKRMVICDDVQCPVKYPWTASEMN